MYVTDHVPSLQEFTFAERYAADRDALRHVYCTSTNSSIQDPTKLDRNFLEKLDAAMEKRYVTDLELITRAHQGDDVYAKHRPAVQDFSRANLAAQVCMGNAVYGVVTHGGGSQTENLPIATSTGGWAQYSSCVQPDGNPDSVIKSGHVTYFFPAFVGRP